MRTTQAVILAGGKGTRLYPLTHTVPKPMVPVAGRPFLEHLVRLVAEAGISEVLMLTGTLAEQIEDHFGDGSRFGVRVRYSRERSLLGTGGALRQAAPLLAERFFLLNGDTFLRTDFAAMDSEMEAHGAIGLLSAFRTAPGGEPLPNLAVSEEGMVRAYGKTAPPEGGNAVDGGVSLFQAGVVPLLPVNATCSLEQEIYPLLIQSGGLRAWWTSERFYDIGTPERLDLIRTVLS